MRHLLIDIGGQLKYLELSPIQCARPLLASTSEQQPQRKFSSLTIYNFCHFKLTHLKRKIPLFCFSMFGIEICLYFQVSKLS